MPRFTARIATIAVLGLVAVPACGDSTDVAAPTGSSTTSATVPAGGTTTVSLTGTVTLKFEPPTLTAPLGDTVNGTLTQTGAVIHTFTLAEFGVDVATTKDGEAKTFTFTASKAGKFTYTCKYHSTMTGTLTVA